MIKEIGTAFPTSTIGGKDGCWYVAVKASDLLPTTIKTVVAKVATEAEARAFAETIPHPFGRYSK